MEKFKHIVIVGGGAGGLELATWLGESLGRKQQANITLIDATLTHVWKPLWHEVAAGTLASGENEIGYIAHAYHHHFGFELGRLIGLDRAKKQIKLEALDNNNSFILPPRFLNYDLLVLAIGSVSHDFAVPGVKQYCYSLDSYTDCQVFQKQLLKNLLRLQEGLESKLDIAIIGGGATGVELAAELQFACNQALRYKHASANSAPKISIQIIENAPRILSTLPENLAAAIRQELQQRGIKVYEGERVIKITEDAVHTKSGLSIQADLKLWAAGIKAPAILSQLGLETNERQQLVVKPTLQTTWDENIFAFGDCAYYVQPDTHQAVPPRAQAAHQQAKLLAKSLSRYLKGKSLLPYYYRDYGSLVTLSRYNTLGTVMGGTLGSITLQGKLARLAYHFLYRRHQAALYGWLPVILLSIAQFLTRAVRPRLKLH